MDGLRKGLAARQDGELEPRLPLWIGPGKPGRSDMPDEPRNDPSQKSPAEGDRETIEHELERQKKAEEKAAQSREGAAEKPK